MHLFAARCHVSVLRRRVCIDPAARTAYLCDSKIVSRVSGAAQEQEPQCPLLNAKAWNMMS